MHTISYTQATGKQPIEHDDGRFYWRANWYAPDAEGKPEVLDLQVYLRLEGGKSGMSWFVYETKAAAMKDADAAYLRAVSDGAIQPIKTRI